MQKVFKLIAISLVLLSSTTASALEASGSDPRIRTLIYGKNDVFKVNAVYGFQTVVELDPNDKILTISVGNPNIFKIIPSQNRLFIKAMQNGQLTNMTIITALRTYQFELSSNTDNPDETMYVVRFLYTDAMKADTDDDSSGPMNLYKSLPIEKQNISGNFSMPGVGGIPSSSQILMGQGINPAGPEPLSMQYHTQENMLGINVPVVNVSSPNM